MTAGTGGGELRRVEASAQVHGLVIYRASRLEALLGPLRQLLAATATDNVLAPQTLIAAHPGMKQWLHGALAREYGAHGIAANLDILLPSAWIDRLAQQRLGQQAVALPRYQRQHLRWSVHQVLGGDLRALGITDARIGGYLQQASADAPADAGTAADRARRRFQLADRLAGLYSQYLVYRPDWLRGWEQGRFHTVTRDSRDGVAAATEQQLLAPLWQHLRSRLGAHRGDVVNSLIGSLQQTAAAQAGEALHVFGVSHLAPSELAVLRAYARQQLVALYVPDPCRQYWGGLARELPQLRQQRLDELARIDEAAGSDYWVEQSHPLLASWGRMGQHFMLALAESEGDVLEDVRHGRDEQPEPPRDRLGRVQQSIRELDATLMDATLATPAAIAAECADASLRVHACHTRLRELEVLRDQLLDALESSHRLGTSIRPADIVVMAPDIQAYVPLIPSVFGVAGDARERLPYHLADVAVARSHPLFGAFRRLLDLSASRLTAPEVVDLLALPEVSRRLGLDRDAVDELSAWLRQSRVAWALDPAFRQRFGVPPIAEHSFGWAMDRLLGGYLMADAGSDDRQPGVCLPDGSEIAPLTGVDGPAASHLGALDQLLQEVQALCQLATQTLPASAWAEQLERRFEALLRIDPTDRDAREVKTLLLRFIHGLASEPAGAGEDPLLHFAVVRDLLLDRLAASPERQRFLMGGITFCGMVPQRAIPFQLVAVLGLNDGEFPRATSDGGLDLMARHRRLGDRDVRTDDRYLFLETLMSARQRLHLSYLGEGVRDGKPRNPAAPLAELLAALDAAAGLRADDTRSDRPWCVRHPLQPFDARYFEQADPRLFSYQARFAAMQGDGSQPQLAPFLDRAALAQPAAAPAPLPASLPAPLPEAIPLRALHGYYRDPARQLLHDRLQLSLDALDDDRLPQHEPLAASFAALDAVARRLFFQDGLGGGRWTLEQAPAWLRLGGIMPPGQPGELAWQAERERVNLMLEQARQLPGFAQGAPPASALAVELRVGAHRLVGTVPDVYVSQLDGRAQWQLLRVFSGEGVRLKAERNLGFKERVPLFLDWAVLRLQSSRGAAPWPAIRLRALVDTQDRRWQDSINAWDDRLLLASGTQQALLLAELEQRVQQLVSWWIEAQSVPRWYFPKAAWETVRHSVYPNAAAPARHQHNAADDGLPDEDERADSAPDDAVAAAAAPGVGAAWIAQHQGGVGERDYAPGYSHLLAGTVDFSDGSPELIALARFAAALQACLTLDPLHAAPSGAEANP